MRNNNNRYRSSFSRRSKKNKLRDSKFIIILLFLLVVLAFSLGYFRERLLRNNDFLKNSIEQDRRQQIKKFDENKFDQDNARPSYGDKDNDYLDSIIDNNKLYD